MKKLRFQFLLSMLLASFIVARTADAHAHLCKDGQEPPASIHLADGSNHPCETADSTGHADDQDVQLTDDGLLKKSNLDDSSAPPPAAIVIAFVPFQVGESLSPTAREPRVTSTFNLRPPLRGPPV